MTKRDLLESLSAALIAEHGDKRHQRGELKLHWLSNERLDVVLSEVEYYLYQTRGRLPKEREVIKVVLELQCLIDKLCNNKTPGKIE